MVQINGFRIYTCLADALSRCCCYGLSFSDDLSKSRRSMFLCLPGPLKYVEQWAIFSGLGASFYLLCEFRYVLLGNLKATSPDLTLNGGLFREQYQTGVKLGTELVLNYPGSPNNSYFQYSTTSIITVVIIVIIIAIRFAC